MPAEPVVVPSPCVRNCCLDSHDVCVGCGRSIDEIMRWSASDAAARQRIVALAKERLEQKKRAT